MVTQDHKCVLIFTVGPVQGFVSQARRTRDLWAGSWLLSYLAESALVAAERAGGSAIVPYRKHPLKLTSENKAIGGVPNRFEMSFDSVEKAAQAGREATEGFKKAWQELCDELWNKYLFEVAQKYGNNTREIWTRQITNFWELSWVVGVDKKQAGHYAAARKNYRNSPFTVEGGFKCSLMGTHQELSGQVRKAKQNQFWEEVGKKISKLDIAPNEHLCAISFVKRLYPKVRSELKQVSWPSTSFIAALPWIKSLEDDELFEAKKYVELTRELGIEQNERDSSKEFKVPWASVDASVWFQGGIERNEWDLDSSSVKELLTEFSALKKYCGNKPLPIWALLVMDGDSLGVLLSKLGDNTVLSKCLDSFAGRVDEVVRCHLGKTVYAGGDDVLAMLPAESAVVAADQLSKAYRACFKDTKAESLATISAAIVFAPLHHPFQQVVKQGHELLDKIAKEKTGRDALAIDIVLGSGLNARWAAPWDIVRGNAVNGVPGLMAILDRFQEVREGKQAENPTFNASFLYNLRQHFFRLFPDASGKPGEFGKYSFGNEEIDILADIANSEYRRRLTKKQASKVSSFETLKKIEQIMWLSRPWTRDGEGRITCDKRLFSFDGWRVARFLKAVKDGDLGEH